MKGAPERILNRCSKILIAGQEVDFTPQLRKEIDEANASFGGLGERVLAFAKYRLPYQNYQKGKHTFDLKNWKTWGLNPKQAFSDYSNKEGTFPMHDLCLIGLVSLNDPPRVGVDQAVLKCRQAGIKVIMVTGDQPATAAAIAQKVNIITKPELEYNNMIQAGMEEHEAWEKSIGIVIHGDELARRNLAEDNLDDLDPEKGRFLQNWISKKEVVFARTSPS